VVGRHLQSLPRMPWKHRIAQSLVQTQSLVQKCVKSKIWEIWVQKLCICSFSCIFAAKRAESWLGMAKDYCSADCEMDFSNCVGIFDF
jgi:hypothetical protein